MGIEDLALTSEISIEGKNRALTLEEKEKMVRHYSKKAKQKGYDEVIDVNVNGIFYLLVIKNNERELIKIK